MAVVDKADLKDILLLKPFQLVLVLAVCSNRPGLIRKYGLNVCHQCFRQYAKDIGFIKLD
uniref:Small ribosomal subunit protein uS14 n=1 Tax=Suricata suricatta TaxID=37032 RepID=A0A673T6N9_SURSU